MQVVPGVDNPTIKFTNCDLLFNQAALGGGAVFGAADHFIFTDCLLANNTTTGTSVSHRGGAIFDPGTGSMTFTRSTVSNNKSAVSGGGISITTGALQIIDSTIHNNSAGGEGGGLIYDGSATSGFVIRNSTISNNTAGSFGGGIAWNNVAPGGSGTLLVQNSTITANTSNAASGGGGISITKVNANAILSLESTIVSNNVSIGAPDIANPNKTNQKTSAVGSNLGYTKTDLGGNLAFGTSLLLGPLANNGGPTLTHLPQVGSPLINVGSNPAALTTDQRGFPRALNLGIDIGSAEHLNTVVKNTNDAGIDSLRQILQDTNGVPGTQTISFDPTVFTNAETITLTSGQLNVSDDVVINGPSSGVTISGNNTSRIFDLGGTALINFTASKLNLTKGHVTTPVGGGAAIRAFDDKITLTDCTLSANTVDFGNGGAVEIDGGGILIATQSTFMNNKAGGVGGAVAAFDFASGTAAIQMLDCSVLDNSASSAGGIYGERLLQIDRCTIANNVATDDGGGLRFSGAFLDIPFVIPALISNSTISGNSAGGSGGGAVLTNTFTGNLGITNSTITHNKAAAKGGGFALVSGSGLINISSSIVSLNVASIGPDGFSSGTVTTQKSLFGSKSGIATFDSDAPTNAILGINPQLGPLQNNGGPTLTHMPAAGSIVVNRGSNSSSLTTDQRGFTRVINGAIDIGSVETRSFLVTNVLDSGAGSLRQALLDTNSFSGSDLIGFDPTVFNVPRTISLLSALPVIADAVAIQGTGMDQLTVRRDPGATTDFRIFTIVSSALNVAIADMTITGGKLVSSTGAGIFLATASATIDRTTISGNSTNFNGGGIVCTSGGSLIVRDSNITANTAANDSDGGGFLLVSSSAIFERSTLANNKAFGRGGAIRVNGNSTLIIRQSTISGNAAAVTGAVEINTVTGSVMIHNSTITANTASDSRSGLFILLGTPIVQILSTVLSGNFPAGSDLSMPSNTTSIGNSAIGSITASPTFTDLGGNLPLGLDVRLAPLANNGGFTQTHAILNGSPLLDAGNNPDAQITDQLGLPRVIGGSIDIGATEFQDTSFIVNNRAAQRSRLTTIKVNFVNPINAATLSTLGAIKLTRTAATSLGTVGTIVQTGATGTNGRIVVSPSSGTVQSVTLTFDNADGSATSPGVENGSLADGRWQLTIPSVGLTSTLNDTVLRRLFGDVDNNGTVDAGDFGIFGTTFGASLIGSPFDFNNDATLDAIDFGEFGARFGLTL